MWQVDVSCSGSISVSLPASRLEGMVMNNDQRETRSRRPFLGVKDDSLELPALANHCYSTADPAVDKFHAGSGWCR
jgi:hypothetical protein